MGENVGYPPGVIRNAIPGMYVPRNNSTVGNDGRSLVKDPETGYLVDPSNAINSFSPERKIEFIKNAESLFPNVTAVCELIGISKATFKNHLILDEKFRNEIERIKEKAIDRVEKHMFDFSSNPKNFMDRIAIMRAYRGELYNPKQQITVTHEVSREEAFKRQQQLYNVVDVELVKATEEVLSSEVSDQPALTQFTVPEPEPTAPAQTPAGSIPRREGSYGGDLKQAHDTRFGDPLSKLEDI